MKSKQEIVGWLEHSENILHKIKKRLYKEVVKSKEMKELYVFKPENNDGYYSFDALFWNKLRTESRVRTLKWVLGQWE
jgi:hypothetical protein